MVKTSRIPFVSNSDSFENELAKAKKLLHANEYTVPDAVLTIIKYCINNQVGFILSRNQHSGNCRDARNKRNRLGHLGIPLYDELKSCVLEGIDSSGSRVIFAVHCRAHKEFSIDAIVNIHNFVESTVKHLPEEELKSIFGMEFGTVNPILLAVRSKEKIMQVFDESVAETIARYPGTMLTNAGNHTWGVEFDPVTLIEKISTEKTYPIAKQEKELNESDLPKYVNPKSIGIITGNGPRSGMHLWERINFHIANTLKERFLGDISFPEVHIISLPAMGLSMNLDKRLDITRNALFDAVEAMKDQNVELLALACHTTAYFQDEIKKIFNSTNRKFISLPEIVFNYITQKEINELAILGINYVSELGEWSAYKPLQKLVNVEKLDDATIDKFNELSFDLKKRWNYHRNFLQLVNLFKKNIVSDNLLIVSTELSVLLDSSMNKNKHSISKNIIDTLEIYAQELAFESLGWIFSKEAE